MKKLFAVLLASAMSLTTVIGASSCGLSEIKDLINQGQEEDDDNGTTGGGTTGGEEKEDMELVQSKFAELGKKSGYEITMTVSQYGDTYTYTSGVKGNVYWSYNARGNGDRQGKAFLLKDEHTYASYEYYEGAWSLDTCLASNDAQSVCESVAGITFGLYLFNASNPYTSSEYYVGTEMVAGRSCDRYRFADATFGVSASYDVSYDKELGCVMKWNYTYTAGGETASTTMEIVSFKTGNDVTAPELPDPGEDYYDYSGILGWPTNSFTALVEKAPGKVTSSSVEYGERFCVTLKEVTGEEFTNYVNALKGMGYSGEEENGEYTGLDGAGNCVEIYYFESNGIMSMTVTKPVD